MGVMTVGLVITILLLSHQISSSIQQSDQLDQFTNETQQELVEARGKISGLEREIARKRNETKDKDVEMSRLTAKMAQIEADLMGKNAKLDADLVDGRESNRELERKVAETKMKNDDLETQLRTQKTEVRDGKAKIGELEGKITALQSKNSDLETQIQLEQENKTAEMVKLQADLNRTMDLLDLCRNRWSYLAKTASWYKVFFSQWMVFDEAEAYCARRKSHLVSIHSQEENDFVQKLAENVDLDEGWAFWIGLKRNPKKGNAFEWTDGSSVNFTNWRSGHPDSNTHAAPWSPDGKWCSYPPINENGKALDCQFYDVFCKGNELPKEESDTTDGGKRE
ncbi:unnamed protein product, partial [Mesorhabditis belari]|uniref:C-type lectin domain-containing protein n=1 Tax=Mesorhabditis belari TaxID=2138241 RepID=A0AAF3F7T5_9BILA